METWKSGWTVEAISCGLGGPALRSVTCSVNKVRLCKAKIEGTRPLKLRKMAAADRWEAPQRWPMTRNPGNQCRPALLAGIKSEKLG